MAKNWKYQGSPYYGQIRTEDGKGVLVPAHFGAGLFEVQEHEDAERKQRAEYNARLIIAAPKLLGLLEHIAAVDQGNTPSTIRRVLAELGL